MSYTLMVVAAASELLRSLPEMFGDDVSVQIYASADDALWEIRSNPPEALIAEVELPGMSGLQLAEIIPDFEVPTRVLLYSPDDETARAAAEEAGVYRFLVGEIAPEELRATLHAAMRAAAEAASQVADEPKVVDEPPPPPTPVVAKAPRATERPEVRPQPIDTSASRAEATAPARAPFTPARVTLPSMKERAAAAAPPPAAKGGLAARSKAVASRSETAPRAAEPPRQSESASGGWRSSSTNLVIDEQNIAAIRQVMSQLAQDLGTQSVMLTDRAGMALVEVGSATNLPMMIVLPLLSTGFATTGEVARQLREDEPTSVYIHEGANVDLYCFDVVQRFLLVLVFNKRVASSKIGAVWINAKRAIRELRDVFATK